MQPTHPLDHIEALLVVHPSKHNMLIVQPGRLDGGHKELGAVGVGARVGHRQEARRGVLDQEVFVVKLGPIDRLATGSVKPFKISTLHEGVC